MGKTIPYIIIGAFVAFGVFVGSFIWKASQSEVNLVSKDYYQQELKYQDRIETLKRSSKYDKDVKLDLNNGVVGVSVPEELVGANGVLHFYRPSNKKLDQLVQFTPNKTNTSFQMSHLEAGHWVLKISLSDKAGVDYYFERRFTL